MAFFSVSPTGTTGVEIAAASTGNRARFLCLGITNTHATDICRVRIYDGTAAGGTLRWSMNLKAGDSKYFFVSDTGGKSVLPKSWFTASSVIEVNLAAAGTATIFGEVVREA